MPPPDKGSTCDCSEPTDRTYATYYDTPDGCDTKTKVGVMVRYGVVTGLVLGTYDVLMYSHAVGFGPMLARYARHVVPLSLMGATFAAVTNTLVQVREVDDSLNYFIGGFVCSPILASYLRSGHALLLGGLALGMAGKVKKDAHDCGYKFIADVKPHMGYVNSWRNNWTLAEDPRDELIHSCGKNKAADDPCKSKK